MRPPPPHPSDTSPRYPHHKTIINNNQHQPTELSNNVLPNVPENDDVAQYRSLTLELTCTRSNNSKENVDVDTIRKVEASDGSIRLIATMPSSTVDGEQANLTAALLFEQIDQLAVGSTSLTYQVERVKINALQFTKEAIVGIQGFLSMFIETIKHVSMKDIVAEEYSPLEEQAFLDLCTIFESCPLETLNLSDNVISAPIWKCWSKQTHLRQLILDFVEIPDDSLCEMAQNFCFGNTLEELYVVLTNHIGPAGVMAANNVLKECRCVGSLRWAVKDAPPDVLMPWRGLANLAQEMSKASKASTLLHLVMDGGTITEEDCGLMGIGGALEYFTQLKTIKFRSIGLKDIGALHIANALCVSQPPLEILDLSRNYIQYNGASSIAAVSEVHNIASNLNYLSLERNNIDANGAIKVLSAFGAKGSQKLDVKLDGNPFNFCKVAYALAWQKGRIEHSHDDSLSDNKNSGHTNNSDRTSNDVKALQDEVLRLQDEKAILMQAFSVVGSANHVVEHVRMLDRISTLETKIFGQPQDTIVPDNSNHMAEDIDTSLRHRTTFSDHSSRAEPPMTPTGSNNRVMMNSNQPQLVNHTNPLRSPMSVYNNNKIKPSNTVHANSGNEYWSASPAGSCYSANSNQKRKVGISGSISETPNMYQNSPNLGGFIKSSSIRSGGSGPEYDDTKKSGRSTSSSVSNTSRNPSPFPRR
jgi:Leucine Rich repeat